MDPLVVVGLTPDLVGRLGLYSALLQLIEEKELKAHHVTLGFVLALQKQVHIRAKGAKFEQVPSDKLSANQFVHCLAFMATRDRLENVSPKMRRTMLRPEELEKQANVLGAEELWPGLSHVPGVDMAEVNKAWEASRGGKGITDTGVVNEEQGAMVTGLVQFI